MAGNWTSDFTFTRGAVRTKEIGYLIAVNDKLAEKKTPFSLLITFFKGQWYHIELKWACTGACVVKVPKEQGVAIGGDGDAYVTGQKDDHPEEVRDGKISPENRGTLQCVRAIEGKAYAAGMDRQVYRRDAPNKWVCIDESMRPPKESKEVLGFEGIDGFSEKEIYAVGWKGEIWMYDGKKWKQIDSPTNLVLTGVCCAGDGNVYATGRRGLLLKGRKNKWQVIKHDSTKQDLWGMAWYNDELYLSSLEQVFVLRKDELEPIVIAEDKPKVSCYHLSAADGVLWSIGPKDVMAFDGKDWTRID
jgi:hypothetical protein